MSAIASELLPVDASPGRISSSYMPSQRAIAAALRLSQSTVSRALRGDLSISPQIRDRVREKAREMGYRSNPHISTLMAHIRTCRPVADKGSIALILDTSSKSEALQLQTYREQYEGMVSHAHELGFNTSVFCMRESGMTPQRIGHILAARGIQGVIFFPPCAGGDRQAALIDWSNYSCATIGATWREPVMDRVRTDYHSDVDEVMHELLHRGYRRIGLALSPRMVELMIDSVVSCREERFRLWQLRINESCRIPLFSGEPGLASVSDFKQWLHDWRPDVVVSVLGKEKVWLDELSIRVPGDIGFVCLNRPLGSSISGMEENHRVIGGTAIDLVISRILNNDFGKPAHPRMLLIKSRWEEGQTLQHLPS